MARKLDRALSNHVWLSEFTESEANFLDPGASDHSPIVVNTGMHLHTRKPPFKFFNFWTAHESCEDVVCQVWGEPLWGTAQYSLCQKLKRLKVSLKALNCEFYANLHSRTNLARENLFKIQYLLRSSLGNQDLISLEQKALQDLVRVSVAEESMERQKSRTL